jgi:ElaB/YqjD/DUF883 family membrane-anchored ribosome-binding protein
MKTDHEHLRAPGDADVYEAERYVEASRAALDDTLRRLERRLSVEGMADSALHSLRHGSGAQYARNLKDSIVRNPLPVTVSVLGMVWTALAERYPPGDGGRGSMHRLKEAGTEEASRLRSGAHDLLEQGRSRTQAVRSRMQQWSGEAAQRSQESAQRISDFSHEHPLIVAGAGLTLGAIIAALLPSTQTEDRRLGRVRDAMLEEVQSGMEQGARARKEDNPGEGLRSATGQRSAEGRPATEGRPAEAVAYPPRSEALEERAGNIEVPVGSDQGPEAKAPPTPGSQDEMRP